MASGDKNEHITSVSVHHGVDDERAVALKLAREADPGLSYASTRGVMFICYALVICMCTGDNGEWGFGLVGRRCGEGVTGVRSRYHTRPFDVAGYETYRPWEANNA